MAYISQDMKKELAPGIKAVLKKYGMKGSIAIDHHSSLIVNLKSGDIDFESQAGVNERGDRLGYDAVDGKYYTDVNPYWFKDHYNEYTVAFLDELFKAMKAPVTDWNGEKRGWYDNSDIMTDYFDIKYYVNVRVGRWDKGYTYTGEKEIAA